MNEIVSPQQFIDGRWHMLFIMADQLGWDHLSSAGYESSDAWHGHAISTIDEHGEIAETACMTDQAIGFKRRFTVSDACVEARTNTHHKMGIHVGRR